MSPETAPFVREKQYQSQDPTLILLMGVGEKNTITTNKDSYIFPNPLKQEYSDEETLIFTDTRSWYALSSEVKGFCENEKLLDSLHKVHGIIQDSFLHIKELDIHLSPDPETGEIVVVFDVTVQGEVDEIVDQYHACTRKWAKNIQESDSDKLRLIFNIT